jgi:hypothetical protein
MSVGERDKKMSDMASIAAEAFCDKHTSPSISRGDGSEARDGRAGASEAAMKRLKLWHKAAGIGLVAAFVFYLTTKPIMAHFDYTHRLALALLDGRLGLEEHPAWLNELVLIDGGRYYTGNYCLGAILSVIPFLFISPHCLTAVIAGMCVFSFFMLGRVEEMNLPRRMMLALFPVFGTWTWTNLGSGGAWDLSQGFGMVGQAGALYFTLVQRQPVVAGSFFALAFGNRAELILTLPIYLFLMKRDWLGFLIVPGGLALLTGEYNFARFHSPFEFGYHRQNLMSQRWCQHGLFSIYPVAYNVYHMLFEGLIDTPTFPFMRPSPWGCSIFLASPFLFLLFREGGKYKIAAWTAIGLLTVVILCHCSQGGWMFSSRYAMILLPWMFLVLAGNGRLSVTEIVLFAVSVAINGVATCLFLWTEQIHV